MTSFVTRSEANSFFVTDSFNPILRHLNSQALLSLLITPEEGGGAVLSSGV